jgi:hypothetical protein
MAFREHFLISCFVVYFPSCQDDLYIRNHTIIILVSQLILRFKTILTVQSNLPIRMCFSVVI